MEKNSAETGEEKCSTDTDTAIAIAIAPPSPPVETLGDDELCHILCRLQNPADRKSLSMVSSRWRRLERLSRTRLTMLSSSSASSAAAAAAMAARILPLYPSLQHIRAHHASLPFIAALCPRLQTLTLTGTLTLTPPCVHAISSFNEEEEEEEEDAGLGPGLTRGSLATLALGCQLLVRLSVAHCPAIVDDAGLSALSASCPSLTHLDISGCFHVTDTGLGSISRLSSLTSLILRGCTSISDRGLRALSFSSRPETRPKTWPETRPSLRELDISECPHITDSGLASLRDAHPELEALSLSKCGPRVTDQSGQFVLPALSSLRKLDLSWLPNISDHSIVSISLGCVNLQELVLTGCRLVSGLGVHAFCGHLSLQALVMAECENVYDDLVAVEELAMTCVSLEFLGLDRGLRQWMAIESLDVIERKCKIEWL